MSDAVVHPCMHMFQSNSEVDKTWACTRTDSWDFACTVTSFITGWAGFFSSMHVLYLPNYIEKWVWIYILSEVSDQCGKKLERLCQSIWMIWSNAIDAVFCGTKLYSQTQRRRNYSFTKKKQIYTCMCQSGSRNLRGWCCVYLKGKPSTLPSQGTTVVHLFQWRLQHCFHNYNYIPIIHIFVPASCSSISDECNKALQILQVASSILNTNI
jgi:hypothetical protein